MWRHCTADAIPVELALLVQAGRELNIHVIADTQRPELVNPSITGAATELVCFKLISPESLRVVEKLGLDRAAVSALPAEQVIKAQTLGAGSWVVAIRVALPQMMPRLIETLRLSMGPAWVFLIAAEAIASDVGLGYRIFLVRRYLAMDIILPYVAWISLLAIAADAVLLFIGRKAFPWAGGAQ